MTNEKTLAFLFTLATLVLFNQTARAQIPSSAATRIRADVEAQDWNSARAEVEKLRSTDSATFRSKAYDYLLARIAEQLSDIPAATKNHEEVLSTNSPLAEYSLWHLARMARATGDLVLERERLRKLISIAPNSLLYDAANLRLAQSFFESGDFSASANAARSLGTSKNVAITREGSLLIGESLVRESKFAEARDSFNKLVMQMPDAARPDDFALAAVRELDELEKRPDSKPNLAEADHLLRASVYQFNRDFAGARVHYQAVIDANTQSGAVPNAIYQIGRGLYLEGKYDDAINRFQTVVDQFSQTQSARDALSSLAASYLRLKRTDDAVAAYKSFISRFPDAPNPERSYLNIIDALHEAQRYSEALSWIQQTRSRFQNQLGGALALFAQQRIHLAQNAWNDVIRDADELLKLPDLGGIRVPGGTTPTEVAFLKAFALEQLGRTDEAITAYLAIPDGRNEYYGNRATQRLLALQSDKVRSRFDVLLNAARLAESQGQFEQSRVATQTALRLSTNEAARSELLKLLTRLYLQLPTYKLQSFQLVSLAKEETPSSHQVLGNQLFNLGLYDEAIPEILAAGTLVSKNTAAVPFSDETYSLARYALRGGLPNRAVRFGEQFWKNVPADYVLEVAPRDLSELLYPAPFESSLLRLTSQKSVDPRFVLSIIRQESRYQVDVKSVSAARGMMQFIPATANEIASQMKMKDFRQDDLYSPDTAILFGSQYLSNLFKQFPNQPQAVAGAYNGGADNLARWIARSRSIDEDRYVPEVGFSQTKDYIYKVMTNYWNYQRLYDAKLQPTTK